MIGALNGSVLGLLEVNGPSALAALTLLRDTVDVFNDEAAFDLYIGGVLTANVVACKPANTPMDVRPPKSAYVPVCRQRN